MTSKIEYGATDGVRLKFTAAINPSVGPVPDDLDVSFIPMEAVGEWGGIDLSSSRPAGEVKKGYTGFREGDVVFAKITPCFENGKGALATGLLNGVAFGTTELHVVRPGANADARWVFYLTQSHGFRRLGESEMYGAGGQKRVPPSFVRDFRVALLPFARQRAIADFLDRKTATIDELIAKKERLIELLQEKRQALITQAVTRGLDPNVPMKDSGIESLGQVPAHWEVRRVRHSVAISNAARLPINRSERAEMSGEYPYWGPTGILDYLNEYRYEGNYALIGEDGDHFNKFATWSMTQWATGRFNVNNHAHVIASGPDCSARWFYWSFHNRDIGADLIAQGVSRLKLTRWALSNLWLAVPPIPEQFRISAFLDAAADKFGETIRLVRSQMGKLGEYRQALITEAVTGKLDVTQPGHNARVDAAEIEQRLAETP